jgi:maleylpyruvate isomerase
VADFRVLLPALHRSTAGLLRGLDAEAWTDADIAAPSLCAGWTRGHVLTHIARNAEGITATLQGALRGELVERYPGGRDARNLAIEEGATRSLGALLDDVRASAYLLDRALTEIDDVDGWHRPTAENHRASEWIWLRFREVEIHRVDLAGAYTAADWPAELIAEQLPQALDSLAERVAGAVRVEITGSAGAGRAVTARTDGEPVVVRGPDWAVLAWLVGRPAAAKDELTALPDLGAWR